MASNIAEHLEIIKSLLKGTNCLFASKDHVQSVAKRIRITFMACSCHCFVPGCLKKKEKEKRKQRKKMEKIVFWPISVYASSSIF